MEETLPHNLIIIIIIIITYMHESIHESSTNAILLMYTELILTHFLRSVISFNMQSQTNVKERGDESRHGG